MAGKGAMGDAGGEQDADGGGQGEMGEEEEEDEPVVPSRWSMDVLSHGPRNVSECRWRLDLFRGLCTKDFDFLQAIAEVFLAIKPALQGPIITEVGAVVDFAHSPLLDFFGAI